MQMDIKLEGLNQLLSALTDTKEAAERATLDVIATLAQDTRTRAVQGIQRGAKSGRVYRKYNPSRVHQASAPGQYPASDTGRFASSVQVELPTLTNLTARVGTHVLYGPMLEFGTSRMAARPWLFPSFEGARVGVEGRLKAAFERKVGR